jgi:uncharacterized protein YdhG (YjbR/CyaY superfamily)
VNGKPADVDGYLATLPDAARATLGELRRVIRAAAPEAVESISYGMPTFKHRGRPLIYFGAAKSHCSLYGTAEGTIRFRPGEPPPEALVTRLVSARIAAIEAAAAGRKGASRPGRREGGY